MFLSIAFVGIALGLVFGLSPARRSSLGLPLPTHGHQVPINPALDVNFPDPSLWHANGIYMALATNNAAGILNAVSNITGQDDYGVSNVQVATSTDLLSWTLLDARHDPLPRVGKWAVQGLAQETHIPKAAVWAPSVNQRPDGCFVLYYSAHPHALDSSGNVAVEPASIGAHPPPHCIGAAIARDPIGPYSPLDRPLACPINRGGAIDADGFRDSNGDMYVVYKVDGNNIGHGGDCGNTVEPLLPTPIMLQKLLADGVTPDGEPSQILDRVEEDGPLVEAPVIVQSPDGLYFLFFSSGCTRSPSYNVKYATATNVQGPYTRAPIPLLRTGDFGLLAPGSVGIHREPGTNDYNMVFHARVAEDDTGLVRAMFNTKLSFNGHVVTLEPVLSVT
ncbi:glycoside hydrolase family 43 protein [Piedraia hortae CBS 480.64]|uniref:Glycoside hydrolase family 43 protein n=1 Tax=Piedraia hortae CBS 480.64 TaxID=1314780 RepID=A0A6A7BSU6_9PEZI|nr:glycoside hydrolase family 43 protein [Piedraia hortae CBS 480.64]